MAETNEKKKGWHRIKENKWFRKFGILAFLFFLIKGLIWLALAAVAYFGLDSIF